MNVHAEWQQLKRQLRDHDHSCNGFENQYFRRVLRVLGESQTSIEDRVLAYRDALLACQEAEEPKLPASFDGVISSGVLQRFGLRLASQGDLVLADRNSVDDDLCRVYQLEQRRMLHHVPTDPALLSKIKDEHYCSYNGVAQRLAVRLALTSSPSATLIVNLPTGCGKTLVAHSLALFADATELTVVIVPTIGLAIEQGKRVSAFLKRAGVDHGGTYYWHGQQGTEKHNEIKTRIKERRQRILFCSPEAACRSLLPTLFLVARTNQLCNIVVDEAHIVDQWGADFRPYFQILPSMLRSLRQVSSRGIRSVLMSATFTAKSLRLVEELFGSESDKCVYINGAFLRPEIQYHIEQVSAETHLDSVLNAAIVLPKPMIIYTVTVELAGQIAAGLRQRLGLTRVGLFTGETKAPERERLLEQWTDDDLDVMVATSAFGLGMDKGDVRSVVHAAVPENLDRFYQEVGRGGRDGCASRSQLIYSEGQIREARKINGDRLITVGLGLEKWKAMWENGKPLSNGRREVAVSAIRADQQRLTDANEEWNWRTLLLMQRAGLISIELGDPTPPSFEEQASDEDYHQKIKAFYDEYYRHVAVTPLLDDHLHETAWEHQTRQRRDYEKAEQTRSLDVLLGWLHDSLNIGLCDVLSDQYTLDQFQPEYACGGCPRCRRERPLIDCQTLGKSVDTNALPAIEWRRPIDGLYQHSYVYFSSDGKSPKRLFRDWKAWLVRLIEARAFEAIRAEAPVLAKLAKELEGATKYFWIGASHEADDDSCDYWPQLVIHMDTRQSIPRLGSSDSTKMLLAPEELHDTQSPHRRWWESKPSSISLNNFLLSLNYGHH